MKGLIIFLTILLFINNNSFGQESFWNWAKRAGNNNHDFANGNCVDSEGNIYVVGGFSSQSITFGSFTLFNSEQNNGVFIVKYNAQGEVIWAQGGQIGYGNDVCLDIEGNIYVTGIYYNNVSFGNYTLYNNNSGFDSFLLKLDSSGNIIWAKSIKGQSDFSGYQYSLSLTSDINGNVLVTGSFSAFDLYIDDIVISNPNIGCGGEIFIAKFDTNGNIIWAKRAGGYGYDQANAIVTDNDGNAYITGYLRSAGLVDFDDFSVTYSDNYDQSFIAKYNVNGNVCWVKFAGHSYVDEGKDIIIDEENNVYVTGMYWGNTISFGDITLDQNYGYKDLFLVKMDSTGNTIWALNAGGLDEDSGTGLSTDSNNNLFLVGYTGSQNFKLASDTITTNGGLFIMKFNSSGSLYEFTSASGNDYYDHVKPNGFSKDNLDNFYVSGQFPGDTVFFGNNILICDTTGWSDVFVAKLNDNMASVQLDKSSEQIIMYPNPVSDILNIKIYHKSSIEIFDSKGQVLIQKVINPGTSSLDFSKFPAGIYYVKSISNQHVYLNKILKQNTID